MYRLALHGVLGYPGLCPFSPQEAGTGCPGSQSPSEGQPSSLCFPKFGIFITFTFLVKSTSVEPPQGSALNWLPRSCSKIRVPSLETSSSSWEMAPYCTHLCPQFLDTSLSAHTVADPGPGVGAESWREHSPLPYLENWVFLEFF